MASRPLAPNVTDDQPEEAVNDNYIPEGYESAAAYLEHARKMYQADYDYDKENRDMALEDMEFTAGDIWDEVVKAAREGRPCLIINNLPQFIGQVIGDARMNKTSIKLRPARDATAADAQARAGIIKGIEHRSRADRVYINGLENQITCGIGNWRVHLDWADEDAFDQDIFISPIPNPLAVLWDRFSVDPTGRDAKRCFVQDNIPEELFEVTWPQAKPDNTLIEDLGLSGGGWFANNCVRVCEFWEMKYRTKALALAMNGEIWDVTDEDVAALAQSGALFLDPKTGQPRIREAEVPYACMHLITGTDILAGPYELPINRLPIIRCEGRVVNVGDDRYRYGLVRWMKDPIRFKCYMRSVAVEKLAMAPRSQWLAEDAAVDGYEEDYRNAHTSTDPLLKYKAGQTKPERVDPPAVDAALLQESQMSAQDMKDVSGIHDASLGIRSNEVSGRAINARKMEGDVATYMYHDNKDAAILETGDVINQLLDFVFDTPRTLLHIGEDDQDKLLEVNNPDNPDSVDLSKGKYSVYVDTGPSFTTQRVEGAQAMMEMIKVAPDIMGLAADLIAKYQDFPGALEIAERLKKAMKAKGIDVGDEDQKQEIPPEMVEQIKQSVMQEFMQSAQGQQLQLAIAKEEQLLRKAKADADRAEAEAEKAEIEAEALPDQKAVELMKASKPDQTPQNNQRSGNRRKPQPKKSKGNKQ